MRSCTDRSTKEEYHQDRSVKPNPETPAFPTRNQLRKKKKTKSLGEFANARSAKKNASAILPGAGLKQSANPKKNRRKCKRGRPTPDDWNPAAPRSAAGAWRPPPPLPPSRVASPPRNRQKSAVLPDNAALSRQTISASIASWTRSIAIRTIVRWRNAWCRRPAPSVGEKPAGLCACLCADLGASTLVASRCGLSGVIIGARIAAERRGCDGLNSGRGWKLFCGCRAFLATLGGGCGLSDLCDCANVCFAFERDVVFGFQEREQFADRDVERRLHAHHVRLRQSDQAGNRAIIVRNIAASGQPIRDCEAGDRAVNRPIGDDQRRALQKWCERHGQ